MTEIEVTFETTEEFRADLKKYARKYRSLKDDLERFKKVLTLAHFHSDHSCEAFGCYPVSQPDVPEGFFVCKKFSCRYMKGKGSRSGFRIVYQLDGPLVRICFIEMYHKNDQPVADFSRLIRYSLDRVSIDCSISEAAEQ